MEVKHRTPPKLPPLNRVSKSSISSVSSASSENSSDNTTTPTKIRKQLPVPSQKSEINSQLVSPSISPSYNISKTPPKSNCVSPSQLPHSLKSIQSSYISPIERPPPLDLSNSFSVVPMSPSKKSPLPSILPTSFNYISKIKSPSPSIFRTPRKLNCPNGPATPRKFNFFNFPVHKKNLFMSHTWRYDELNRDTHQRVKLISNALRHIGYTTWFDEDDMVNGNIDISMAEGIDNCDCFIVCLTKNYINKINEASRNMLIRDNCYKEFNYANVSNKIMIPLILEPGIKRLSGIIGLYLGNQYFIDFSFSDFKSKDFYESIDKLDTALKKYKIIENSIKKHTEQISKFKSKLYNSIHMYKRIYPVLKRVKSNKIFNYTKEKNKKFFYLNKYRRSRINI